MRPFLNLTVFSLFLSIVLLLGCQTDNGRQNIRAYYYPVQNFMDGKVYEYRAVNDSLAPFYWYFRTTISKGDTILTSEYFDHDFVIQQLTNEEFVKNGVVLNDFYLYEIDTLTGQQVRNPVRVEVDNVYPFEVTDSNGVFLYKVFWKDYYDPQQKFRLIKNRRFMDYTSYPFQGKSVECVRFKNKELLEIEAVGFQELTYNSVELYAKNIGLIYFRKEIDGNIVQEYELADVYEMTDLEAKFKASMESD
ncbi:MAG: hypothetical protein AAF960_06545 [Bacteroidota bacterium]